MQIENLAIRLAADFGERGLYRVLDGRRCLFGVRDVRNAGIVLDVLARATGPLDTSSANRVAKVPGGMPASIAGIDDLIALKKNTGRKIDASDVEALNTRKKIQSERK